MSIGKSTDTSTDRTLTTPNWETLPCVQYGFPEGKGPKRSARLNTIFDPIPEGANTASPIYLVPQERYKQQRDNENPHRVSGDYNSLATEVQDECENDDSKNRVLYPFHVESDEYLTEGPETLIRWIREFVEDRLELPFQTCTLYFSGNRSIHAHIPRIIQSDGIAPLKELAETFCEETGAKLDCGIYSRKRLFRLPGVIHQTTGFRKIQIQPEWDEDRLRQALSRTPDVPESYEAVLRYVFLSQPSTPIDYTPDDIFRSLKGDETLLDLPRDEPAVEVETPLIERTKENLEDASEVPEWSMYNSKEFSPYALASGNPRSVAALKIKGGPFARKEKRNGATMVPAYFYGARGCAGEKYTKDQVHAPLQLSRKDYGKWDYEAGEKIVIIGGQNRTSIILRVSSLEAIVVGHALTALSNTSPAKATIQVRPVQQRPARRKDLYRSRVRTRGKQGRSGPPGRTLARKLRRSSGGPNTKVLIYFHTPTVFVSRVAFSRTDGNRRGTGSRNSSVRRSSQMLRGAS